MGSPAGIRVIREDVINALREMNTYIDVTVEDLEILFGKTMKHATLREKEGIPIESVMTTEVVTANPRLPLRDAANLLVQHKISGLPVVNHDQQLVGILTEADLLRSIGLPSHHPSNTLWQTLESMFSHHHSDFRKPSGIVADLMIEHVITVDQDATLHDAIAVMKKHKIKRVIVSDRHRHLKGIITRSNLVRVFFDKLNPDGQ